MTGKDADVIVVGGGPAGSATATLLARRGFHVVLLEKAEFPREKACGEYLSPGVVDALERLHVLDQVITLEHARPPGMHIKSSRAQFMLTYPDGESSRSALGIQRPLLDSALLNHAKSNGVDVRYRVRALGAISESGRVTGLRIREDGEEHQLHAPFVVAADGLHSTVARSLGLDRPVRWPLRLGLVARYAIPPGTLNAAEMHVGAGVYCGLNPVGDSTVNVGLVGPVGGKLSGETTEDLFERRLSLLPGASSVLQTGERISRIRGMGPLARKVSRVSGPGFLLVGDAAGFFDPFTGEGVHRALVGAELAAAAAEQALQRTDRAPEGYEQMRRAAFADKERVCLLVQMFLATERGFDYAINRLNRRSNAAVTLAGVLGDYMPARQALRPPYLWGLVRP